MCTRCRVEKPLSEFSTNRHRGDGVQAWCRACHRDRRRETYAADPTNARIYNAAYRRAGARLRALHPGVRRALLNEELADGWEQYRLALKERTA